jgi:hypothetical protein
MRWVAPAVLGVVLPAVGFAAGGGPTGCVHLCQARWLAHVGGGGSGPCVVDSDVAVVPGSVIDCETLDVHVTAASTGLSVQDGHFVLKANSLLVQGQGRKVLATCSGATGQHGFRVQVIDDVVVTSDGEIGASCPTGGGSIEIDAGGDVTFGGNKNVKANGTAAGGPGGRIVVRAGGVLTASVPVEATAESATGSAAGGAIDLRGASVTIQAGLLARGQANRGGQIEIAAPGGVVIATTGTVDASSPGSDGDGGTIGIESGGTVLLSRPMKAEGGAGDGSGGTVGIEGERVVLDHDIRTSSDLAGGEISLESRGGPLEIGAGGAGVLLDLKRDSNNPGDGGTVTLRSRGNAVVLGSAVTVDASGGGAGGSGGTVAVAGVTITTAAGSSIDATPGGTGSGGDVLVTARDQMTLGGVIDAETAGDGTIALVYRTTPPTVGSGVACPCETIQDASLPAPCGDGIRREGHELCDGSDVGAATCAGIGGGFTGGILGCLGTCQQYDTAGCTP